MASYLRPRRGKKSTAESQNIILKRGEIFFESPESGVGTGTGKIKIGDGVTVYSNLPYFLQQVSTDVPNAAISFTEASSNVSSTLLSAFASGAKLNTITGIIKKLLTLHDTSITNLQSSFQNGCSTIANAITANGVTTATNASPDTIATNINTLATNKYNAGVTATKVGTAIASQVLTGTTFTNSSGVGLSGTMVNNGAWINIPTTSGNVTIPAGYHNGSGYVNTTTVYNNGYIAGVATGKKYVKVTNVAKTIIGTTDYWYNSYNGTGSWATASASNVISLILWSNVTSGSWIPSLVKLTATSTDGKNKFVTYIDSTDKMIFTECILIDSTTTDLPARSRLIFIAPSSNITYPYAVKLFLDDRTGFYFPFLYSASSYQFDVEVFA